MAILSVAYTWPLIDRGWVPHDEGTLAQSALRVLHGELPHRDFEEIYTGGLTYLNAFVFQLAGIRLVAMRYMAYLLFICWIPVLYYLASRWLRPPLAGLLVLTAVAWSYPNYPAAMPSWYVLFFATATAACLTRYLEARRKRWLLAAGVAAGICCLFKIVGLYVIAAALLFFVYLEQRSDTGPDGERRWYGWLTTAGLLGFAGAVYLLVSARLGWRELVQFAFPAWMCVGLLLVQEWRCKRAGGGRRLRMLLGFIGPFVGGVTLSLLPYLTYFQAQDGLDDLLRGIFVTPFRRLGAAAVRPPPMAALAVSALVFGLVVLAERLHGRPARLALVALGGTVTVLLVSGGHTVAGQLGYLSLSQAVPIIVGVGVILLAAPSTAGAGAAHERLAVLTFLSANLTLVQYPFSTPTYFAFIAPVILVTASAAVAAAVPTPSPALGIGLTFYLLYAVLWFTPAQFRLHNGRGLFGDAEVRTLLPGLADLRVSLADWVEYETLVPLVKAKARGQYIFASPDSPEVYVLSGRRNPTRSLFDFFDPQEGRTSRILDTIDRRGVNLVVINNRPLFSPPVEPALARALTERFPHDSVIGRFTVRWK